ncbi:hypothetical protein MRX96_022770 [Rhipicephalus microplus]
MDSQTLAIATMIIFSEMGDKTFFITALMAMKHSKASAIAGALSANALMSVFSVMQKDYTHYLSVILLVIFGSRMIAEGYAMEKTQTKVVIQEAENEISTIALAANESVTKVAAGAILGHAVCIVVAAYGGCLIANRMSLRSVTLLGGCVFLLLACSNVIMGPTIWNAP